MSPMLPGPYHQAFYRDLLALFDKYAGKLPADVMLALSASATGAIIAMQDQRTMTNDRAMQIVMMNIVSGNEHVVDQVMKPKGNA